MLAEEKDKCTAANQSRKKSKAQRELEKLAFSVNYDRPPRDGQNGMKLLCWNVREMNSASKKAVMKGLSKCYRECIFIQETKMERIDDQILRSFCPWRNSQYVFCLSIGASRGILLVQNAAF